MRVRVTSAGVNKRKRKSHSAEGGRGKRRREEEEEKESRTFKTSSLSLSFLSLTHTHTHSIYSFLYLDFMALSLVQVRAFHTLTFKILTNFSLSHPLILPFFPSLSSLSATLRSYQSLYASCTKYTTLLCPPVYLNA